MEAGLCRRACGYDAESHTSMYEGKPIARATSGSRRAPRQDGRHDRPDLGGFLVQQD